METHQYDIPKLVIKKIQSHKGTIELRKSEKNLKGDILIAVPHGGIEPLVEPLGRKIWWKLKQTVKGEIGFFEIHYPKKCKDLKVNSTQRAVYEILGLKENSYNITMSLHGMKYIENSNIGIIIGGTKKANDLTKISSEMNNYLNSILDCTVVFNPEQFHTLSAQSSYNIVNWTARKMGVQFEMSMKIREKLLYNDEIFEAVINYFESIMNYFSAKESIFSLN